MILEIMDLNNRRVGVIKDFYDLSIEYEPGTWDKMNFCVPINSASWSKIKEEMRIRFEGKYFVIKGTGVKMDSKGVRHQEVKCQCLASDLNYKYNQVLDVTGTPEVVLDTILEGSGWTRGIVSMSGNITRTIQSEWQTVVANLNDAAEKFNAYLFFHSDTRTVDLIDDPGQDRGVTIQVGKDIVELTRDTDSSELVTRLYAYGSDDLTFNNENPGKEIDNELRNTLKSKGFTDQQIDAQVCGKNQSFIQDFIYFQGLGYSEEDIYTDILTNGEASKFIKVGHLSEPDYVDPQVLLDHSKKKLGELRIPKFTYRFSIVLLSELSGYESESFEPADWIYAYDRDFNIDIKTRISKMIKYPGFPEKTQIEVSNAKNNLSDVLTTTIKLGEVLGNSPRVSNLVKGIINTVSTTINSANGELSWSDGVFEAIDKDNPDRRVRITSGGIGVSIDGGQTYENAIVAEGILANKIIVTDAINLFSEDKSTRMTGSGIEIYDISPSPVKRAHFGHYSSGKFGLWINAGSLEIVGSLPQSNIPDISANKIVGGTLGATSDIYVGANGKIKIDGLRDVIEIYDSDEEPNLRVSLGKISGGYGIEVLNSNGDIMFSSIQNRLFIGSGGSLVIGENDVNFALKFDGTDLIFGPGSIKWDNLSEETKLLLKGEPGVPGAPGEPGPPGEPGSDANVPDWVTEWNDGNTTITSGYICSPKIFIGEGGSLANGIKMEFDDDSVVNRGIISYVNGLKNGFSLNYDGTLELYQNNVKKGEFRFDTNGTGWDNPNRVFLRSMPDVALKLESGGQMSIHANTGNIFVTSPIRFTSNVDMSNVTLDLTNTTIIGALAGVAKFK
jgi:hypothetical protein